MRVFNSLSEKNQSFIRSQKVFFVGSAPLSGDGHVNVSPKGYDSLRILDERSVAYLDLGGSGIETQAHLQENGRLCMMFCAFEGDPLILRLYGTGRAHGHGTPRFDELRPRFESIDVPARAVIELEITRVQESCGWAVPFYEFQGERTRLMEHNASRSEEDYLERRYRSNAKSIDGLPGFERT